MSTLKTIGLFIASGLVALASLLGYNAPQTFGGAVSNPSVSAVFETSLASPIGSADVSMILASNVVDNAGDTLPNVRTCFTLDQGSSVQEFVCGTVSGTSVTGLTRGVSPLTGTSTVAALGVAHRRGADVKITDWPTVGINNNQLNGAETLPNPIIYAVDLSQSQWSALASTSIPDIAYVNRVSIAGAANSSESVDGISQLATAAQAALGTLLGSTAGRLVLPASLATSTPGTNATTQIPVTIGGKLAQAFWDLTQNFSVSGLWTFTGATTTISSATTTITGATSVFGIGTTTPMSGFVGLMNGLNEYVAGGFGIGIATTSPGNLVVRGLASTTNLMVSGTCTNCAQTATSTNFSGIGSSPASITTVTASCAGASKMTGGGFHVDAPISLPTNMFLVISNGPETVSSWKTSLICNSSGTCPAGKLFVDVICSL